MTEEPLILRGHEDKVRKSIVGPGNGDTVDLCNVGVVA